MKRMKRIKQIFSASLAVMMLTSHLFCILTDASDSAGMKSEETTMSASSEDVGETGTDVVTEEMGTDAVFEETCTDAVFEETGTDAVFEETCTDAVTEEMGTDAVTKESYIEIETEETGECTDSYDNMKEDTGKASCRQTELVVTADDEEAVVTLEGNLPTDLTASVNATDIDELTLNDNYEIASDTVLYAYDISLYSEGQEYEPENGAVTVSLTGEQIEKAAGEERKLTVWHISDDGTYEQVENVRVEGDTIVFEAERFSIYIVQDGEDGEILVRAIHCYFLGGAVRDENNPDYYVSSPYFYQTGDGNMACYQVVKDGDYIQDVVIPDERFMGWVQVYPDNISDTAYDENTKITYRIPENPQIMKLGSSGQAVTVTDESEDIYLAPLYSAYGTVVFYEEDDNADGIHHIHTEKFVAMGEDENGEFNGSVETSDVRVSSADPSKIFTGWKGTVGGMEQHFTLYDNDTGGYVKSLKIQLALSDFTDHYLYLYPTFESVYWLTFDTQAEDAAFVDAIFADSRYGSRAVIEDKNILTSLAGYIPRRAGYSFMGWYSEPECTNQVTDENGNIIGGAMTLTGDTRLYAKWKETEVTYTIVYWQQSIDERNTPESLNADKLYDYYMSETYTGTAGDSVADIVQEKVFAPFSEKAANSDNLVHGFHLRLEDGTAGDGRDGNFSSLGYYYQNVTWENVDTSCYDCTDTGLAHDSSTVINVYYDRNIIQVVLNYMGTYASLGTVNQYGLYKQPYPGLPELGGEYYWRIMGGGYQLALQLYDLDAITNTSRYNYRFLSLRSMTSATNGVCFELLEKDDGTYPALKQISDYPYCELVNPDDAEYLVQTDMLGATLTVTAEKFEGHILQSYALDNTVNWQTHDGTTSLTVSGYTYYAVLKYARLSYDLDYYVDGTKVKTSTLKYHESLADCDDRTLASEYVEVGRHLISQDSKCWFADPECTIPFDFSGIMPSHNVAVYAKTTPNIYTVTLDPNGGEGSHGSVLVEHGGKVTGDISVTRDYYEDSAGNYYYRYVPGVTAEYVLISSADYTDDINAGYIDPGKKYSKYTTAGKYRFLGWYEVDEYGNPTLPFLFDEKIVTSDITLKAVWQYEGNYRLRYISGEHGKDADVYDPADENTFYQGMATAVAKKEPAQIDEGYVFEGWQIVGDSSGKLYQPGETFFVDDVFADQSGVITFTATYNMTEESPKITEKTITVKIVGNGDNVVGDDVTLTVLVNEHVDLAKYVGYFTRPDYVQTGWAFVPVPQKTDVILDLKSIVAADNEEQTEYIIYAIWAKMPAPTSYDDNSIPYNILFGLFAVLPVGTACVCGRRHKTKKMRSQKNRSI